MKRALSSTFVLAVLLTAALPAAAVDAFYRNRMEAGIQAFDTGDWPSAARQLRIACFGYLEEPVALAAGLIRLTVAQAEAGDDEAVRTTFVRLIQLEERYSAYSEAAVPAPVRQQFELHAARRVPLETLRFAAGFEAIAEQAEMAQLAGQPVEQRRATLERSLAADPDRPALVLEMARLELQLDRPRVAFDWLGRLPAEQQAMPPASCLRQQAAAESRDCALLDPTQPFCDDVPSKIIDFSLQCLVDADRWAEAADLLAGLPPGVRRTRRLIRLEKKVAKNQPAPQGGDVLAAAASPGGSQAPSPAAKPPATTSPTTEPPTTEPSTIEPPGEAAAAPANRAKPQEFERLRRRLATAVTAEQLAELLTEVEELANRQPAARQVRLLAAEIAYLRSDWTRAIFHFRQAGELQAGEESLAFYLAVALFESGEPGAAAEVLRPVASRLERSSFVDAYVESILGPGI